MYLAYYGDATLHDPYSDDAIADLRIDASVNECGTCTFTVPSNHALRHSIRKRSGYEPLRIYDDDVLIFEGFVYETEQDMYDDLSVTCKGDMAYLGDTIVRPYTTNEQSEDYREDMAVAPSSVDGLFRWYVEQHNAHCGEAKRFTVGVNEGALLDENDYILRSSTEKPTTADEIKSKLLDTLGGYVFVRHVNGDRIIDYRAGCVDVNAQIIDFGVNISDYLRNDTTDGMSTAIRPEGATPEGSESPITVESLVNGPMRDGFVKDGDVIYNQSAVNEYGYIECAYSDSDAETAEGLAESAIAELESLMEPVTSIEVKAIDLHLFMGGYEPLVPGSLVRVRSKPHGIDQYMLVSSAEIDCADPSSTIYTLGAVQSGLVSQLNAGINSAMDAVAPISEEAKAAAKDASAAKETAESAYTEAATKRRVFTSEPTPPYDVGDLWVRTDGDSATIMVCSTAKEE